MSVETARKPEKKLKPGFRLDQVKVSIERNQKLVLIGQAFVACHNVFEKSDCSEIDIIEFDTVFQRLYNQVAES